jgi:hypothetical protein
MRWIVGVAWVAVCAVACGGDVSSPGGTRSASGGAVSSFGGAANGGSVSSAGGTAGANVVTPEPRPGPDVPPPPDDACAPLHEVWAHVPPAADGSMCPVLSCPCSEEFFSYVAKRGCLVSVDCDAKCSREGSCLEGYDPCKEDSDCLPGVCVKDAGQSMGECATGTEGARCRTDAHCPGGRCVAIDQDGRRACVTAKPGAICNEDLDCDSKHCVALPGSFLGTCSDRGNGSPCYIEKEDCLPGLACVGVTGAKLGTCGPQG